MRLGIIVSGKENTKHEESPQVWSPLVAPMKVYQMFCSLYVGEPGLRWAQPGFGQEHSAPNVGCTGMARPGE